MRYVKKNSYKKQWKNTSECPCFCCCCYPALFTDFCFLHIDRNWMLTHTNNNKTEQLSQIMFLLYGILKTMYLITSRNKVQEPSKLKYVFLMFHYAAPTPNRNISKKCYTHYWHPKQVCLQHCNILHHLYQHVSFQRIHFGIQCTNPTDCHITRTFDYNHSFLKPLTLHLHIL